MFGKKNPLKIWCPSSSIPEIPGTFLASEACNSKTTDSCKSCCICLAKKFTELQNPRDSCMNLHVLFMFIYFLYHLPLGFHSGFSWLKINEPYGTRIWFHLVACNKQVLLLNPWNQLEPVVLPRQFTDSMRSWECWLVGRPKIVSRRWGECVNVKKIYQHLSNVKYLSNLFLWKVKWRWCYISLEDLEEFSSEPYAGGTLAWVLVKFTNGWSLYPYRKKGCRCIAMHIWPSLLLTSCLLQYILIYFSSVTRKLRNIPIWGTWLLEKAARNRTLLLLWLVLGQRNAMRWSNSSGWSGKVREDHPTKGINQIHVL